MKRIVIIGGCAAGPKTAAKCKRLNPENIIELYTQENMISYSACGMPYFIQGTVPSVQNLIIRTKEDFEEQGISVFLNHRCIKINPDDKTILVINNDETKKIPYDDLVICTGSAPFIPKITKMNLKNIHTLKVIKDGIEIREKMLKAKNALIIGGGYIAIELLEAFVKNNLKTTVLERSCRIMSLFDPEISAQIKEYIENESNGLVHFILEDEAVEFVGEDSIQAVITKSGKIIDCDLCIVATGVVPNVELAREAGLKIGITGAIKVDNRMRTSIPNIWAAGDCTEENCLITKRPIYIALGTIANKQGRVAAININTDTTGNYETFCGILGSAVTRYFDLTMSATGLSEKRANDVAQYVNIVPISATVTESDKAGYMPKSENITVKLVADKRTGELIGAQAIGRGDADKRINSIASALRASLTVAEFLHLDFTYSPAYSSTIDPLLTAAYELKKKMDES